MRVAALADVHGNVPALDAVLADVETARADLIVSCGDLIGGPRGRDCLDALLPLGERVRFVRGNADREVPELAELVASWPTTVELDVDGLGHVVFCHGSPPRSDEEILTKLSPGERVAAAVAGVDADVVVCGHTHVQFDRDVGGVRLVNTGSVGMPYEGRHGAFWALLGPDVELRRSEYDVEAAVESFGPHARAQWHEHVSYLLEPPDADEASAYFEAHAGT